MKTQTQVTKIYNHLLSGRSITPKEALKIAKSMNLAQRIADIKRMLLNSNAYIESVMIKVGKKRVSCYTLIDNSQV